jgi:hypothetical protein
MLLGASIQMLRQAHADKQFFKQPSTDAQASPFTKHSQDCSRPCIGTALVKNECQYAKHTHQTSWTHVIVNRTVESARQVPERVITNVDGCWLVCDRRELHRQLVRSVQAVVSAHLHTKPSHLNNESTSAHEWPPRKAHTGNPTRERWYRGGGGV